MQNLIKAHLAIAEFNELLFKEIKNEAQSVEECFLEMGVKNGHIMIITCYANFKNIKSTLRVEAILNDQSHKAENLDEALAIKLANYIRGALNEAN